MAGAKPMVRGQMEKRGRGNGIVGGASKGKDKLKSLKIKVKS